MPGKDIFLSYASQDKDRIRPLVRALQGVGWSVFWDATIPTGKTWRQVIGEEIQTSRCMVVAWSKSSIESGWVQEEADEGRRRQTLFPVMIDAVAPPLGFGAIQTADFVGWDGAASAPAFRRLVTDLSAFLGVPPHVNVAEDGPAQAEAAARTAKGQEKAETEDLEERPQEEARLKREDDLAAVQPKPRSVKNGGRALRPESGQRRKTRAGTAFPLLKRAAPLGVAVIVLMTVAAVVVNSWRARVAEASFNTGEDYYYGRSGQAQDYSQAFEAYSNAAELGHAAAQSKLGVMYAEGSGVPKDEAEAVKWFHEAAEQGFAESQFNLGIMYVNGRGVLKDEREAVKWFREAAEQGFAAAQMNMGIMYANGWGVGKDDAEAVGWYRKAAEQGFAAAQTNLGFMYSKGHGVRKDEAKAVKWYQKAASQGNADAQFNLGVMYENGRGVPKDDTQAHEWYHKAAGQGHASAKEALSRRNMEDVTRSLLGALVQNLVSEQ